MKRTGWIGLVVALLMPIASVAAVTGAEDLIDQQNRVWQPAAPSIQTPLWPKGLAIASPATPGEEVFGKGKGQIGGRPVTIVEHVSVPTMTIYRPRGENTGAAVVVFPGGGYRVLAIDLEGTEVCDWLTAKGITCVGHAFGLRRMANPITDWPALAEKWMSTIGVLSSTGTQSKD